MKSNAYTIVGMMSAKRIGETFPARETFATAEEARNVASGRSRTYTLSVVRVERIDAESVRLVEWV